jgi:DnaJ-class molecular chaperone
MNPDDASAKQKFQDVQRAYEVLNDPQQREMYDRYGGAFESAGGARPGGAGGTWRSYGGGAEGFQEVDINELFGRGFGGGGGGFDDLFRQFNQAGAAAGARPRTRRGPQSPQRGGDLRHEVTVPFATAVKGGKVHLSIRRPDGSVEPIEVKVPAGIPAGKPLRIRGKGEASPDGGEPGDILLTVNVAPHPYFTRDGNDLELKLPVTLAEAALGSKIDVPTPHGTVALKIPPGTSSGKRLRVKGQGIKPDSGQPGDLYVEVQIVLPRELNEADLELIRQLDQRNPLEPRRELAW